MSETPPLEIVLVVGAIASYLCLVSVIVWNARQRARHRDLKWKWLREAERLAREDRE